MGTRVGAGEDWDRERGCGGSFDVGENWGSGRRGGGGFEEAVGGEHWVCGRVRVGHRY